MLIPSPAPILRFDDDGDRLMFHLLTHQRGIRDGWPWAVDVVSNISLDFPSYASIRTHRFMINHEKMETSSLHCILLLLRHVRSFVRCTRSMLLMLLLRFGFVLRCCIAMGQISAAAVAAANPDRSPEPTARGGCDSAL